MGQLLLLTYMEPLRGTELFLKPPWTFRRALWQAETEEQDKISQGL